VWSAELHKSIRTAGTGPEHNVFNANKSSTFNLSEGQTWNITYGDGSSASGTVGKDVVDIGGLAVKNQSVELADTLSTAFQKNVADGILGLGFVSCLNTA
jgi:hypothetical protein